MKAIMAITVLLLSSCSLITTEPLNPHKLYLSENDLSDCISSTSYIKKCWKLELGEAYARRSVYSARNQHAFNNTLVMVYVANDVLFQTSEPGMWLGSLFFYATTPFIFVYELGKYPISLYDHLTIDEAKVDAALQDLKFARKNGYDEKYMNFIPLAVPVKHLDDPHH